MTDTITLTREQAELVILWLGRDAPRPLGATYYQLNGVVRVISHQLDGISPATPWYPERGVIGRS